MIRRELSQVLHFKVRDPRIHDVTITQVRMTADLKEAKVYYDWVGDAKARIDLEKTLQKSVGFLRREIAAVLMMKTVPRISFFYDETRELFSTANELLKEDDT